MKVRARQFGGICLIGCLLLGAARVQASDQDRQTISDNRFLALFSEYIRERSGLSSEDVVVSRFKAAGSQPAPSGSVHFRIEQPRHAELKGFVTLGVRVEVNGVFHHRVRLSGWVETYRHVVFAAGNMQRGQIIERSDLTLKRVNTARMHSKVLTDVESALGRQCKHSIRSGAAVKAWMVERAPVVSKGDFVTIIAESTGVRVTVPGRIMETGYENELVAVQNTMSKKRVHARVVDSTSVSVEF